VAIPNARDERRAREIERTRQDILDAAARVFAQGGFHAATVAAIAREAGFTAASLYTYFESKEAIYQALKEDIQRRVLATYDLPAPTGLSFSQRLELLLQRQLALLAERLDQLRVFLDAPSSRADERDVRAAFLERATHFLAETGGGELRIPPREAAHVLFGLLHARVLAWLLGEEEPDPPSLAARAVDLFLHGAVRGEPAVAVAPNPLAGELP
jgi:AcrR family transcriptional regulator